MSTPGSITVTVKNTKKPATLNVFTDDPVSGGSMHQTAQTPLALAKALTIEPGSGVSVTLTENPPGTFTLSIT